MTKEGTSETPPKPFSPALISLLSIIERSNASKTTSEESEEVVKNLVALRSKNCSLSQEDPLSLKELIIALRTSFVDYQPVSLQAKVEVVGWVASLLQSQTTYKIRTICAVIQELTEVVKLRWLTPENAEHWLPLCINLSILANACVDALRKQHESALAGFLVGSGWTHLSQVIIGSNVALLKILYGSSASRSASFKTWCQEVFEVQSNYFAFLDAQILPSEVLRHACGGTLTMVCNMFVTSANEFISEFKILNLTCKAFLRVIPYCRDTSEYRLNRGEIVAFICSECCSNAQAALSTAKLSSDREKKLHSRVFTLLRFFVSHLRHVIFALAPFLCRSDDSAVVCRNFIRFTLCHLRSRLMSNEVLSSMHPTVSAEVIKYISPLEDACISTLLEGADGASDDEKFELFYEYCYSAQPKLKQFKGIEPLTSYEWNYGRLHIILRVITIFDQFSPELQLRLFPATSRAIMGQHQPPGTRLSLVSSLMGCINGLHHDEFVPLMDRRATQPSPASEDLYLQILSDLAIFALLLQPAQFMALRIEMLGLVFHSSEIISLLAIDWWRCMANRLGQTFIVEQVLVLSDMLGAIPEGDAANKLSRLVRSLCQLLNPTSQDTVAGKVLSKLENMSASLLSNFPFESMLDQNLDALTNRIMETWRECFEHLEDLNIVVDVFYAMHPYIASLASIFSGPRHAGGLQEEVHQSLSAWCVNILQGCQELVTHAQSRPRSVEKIACTVEHIVALLRVIQPLSRADLIQVLDVFTQWTHLPKELRPLSPGSMAQFLASCGAVEIFDEEEMTKIGCLLKVLYTHLFENPRWIVFHQAIISFTTLSTTARSPQILQDVIPEAITSVVWRYQRHELPPEHATAKEEKAFWAELQKSMEALVISNASVSTTMALRDLKTLSKPVVSKQECLQGLRAATTYLEGLVQEPPESVDQGLRVQLTTELWALQSLIQQLVGSSAP